MFGIKNPRAILTLMKGFGLTPQKILPELEKGLYTEWSRIEQEADAPLLAVVQKRPDAPAFQIALYKDHGGGSLEMFREIDLSKILENVLNPENNQDVTEIAIKPEARPAGATIPAPAIDRPAPAIDAPHTDAGAENTATPDTDPSAGAGALDRPE